MIAALLFIKISMSKTNGYSERFSVKIFNLTEL